MSDEFYYPITRQLVGPPTPRALVPPVIAPTLFSFSDPATRVNDSRPVYLQSSGFGYDAQDMTPITPTSSESYEHNSMSTVPLHRDIHAYNIDSDVTVYPTTQNPPVYGYGITSPRPLESSMLFEPNTSCLYTPTGPETVYDPRTGGFGDERRGYLHPVLAQPRYDYSDVDAARIPQYLSRNALDTTIHANPWFAPESSMPLKAVTVAADAEFIRATNQMRLELQECAMRKYNNERGWQQRQDPKRVLF